MGTTIRRKSSTLNNLDPVDEDAHVGGGLEVSPLGDYDADADADLLDVERERAAAERSRQLAPAPRIGGGSDTGKRPAGAWTAPTDAPLASATHGTPAVESWRVYRDEDGARNYLGKIGSHASPEALIRRFSDGLPPPGESALYILRGVGPDGKDIPGLERPFRISGDSPDVQAARARVIPATGVAAAPSPLEGALAQILARQQQLADQQLADQREANQRAAVALDEERREVAARATALASAAAQQQQDWASRQLALEVARHTQSLESERERRRQDREDLEARVRSDREDLEARVRTDREERDRRDAREREERGERERERERSLERERDRDREHQQRIAALSASQSLETMATKGAALATALGINPGEIIQKILGGGSEPAAAGMSEGTGAAVVGLVGKIVEQIGSVVSAQMQIQAAQQQEVEVTRAPPRRVLRLPPPPPEPVPVARPVAARTAAPAPARDPVPVPVPQSRPTTPATPATPNPNPDLPMPVMKRARLALRDLSRALEAAPESEWTALLLAAAAKTPQIVVYAKAVGLERACAEAGLSPGNTAKLTAKASAMGLA
ncbi:MAG: hypothetical protein Q8P18_33275 [Pseudomonadota bacterium]|nr:hypothetical protein [Pseudomonadota bacterium]